jgi:hypothetical protein
MVKKKVFLASSSELKEDREGFEIFINRKNKAWADRGIFIDLVQWEDFLDAVSRTRLQDDYNEAIRDCDIFVMLFFSKVGQYTEEEFETAFGQFQATNRPFIFTYFKDANISLGSANEDDLLSLLAFKKKLSSLGHFYTRYKNIDELKLHFDQQLDKLAASEFIEFKPDKGDSTVPSSNSHQTHLTGSVTVGRDNTGSINTGTQFNTGGGLYVGGNVHAGGDFVGRDKITYGISPRDLEALFAPLLALVVQKAPSDQRAAAEQQVQELKAEVAMGKEADDSKVGKIIDGLVNMVPGAIGTVVNLFATPILGGIAGPVTKFVLEKLKGS